MHIKVTVRFGKFMYQYSRDCIFLHLWGEDASSFEGGSAKVPRQGANVQSCKGIARRCKGESGKMRRQRGMLLSVFRLRN